MGKGDIKTRRGKLFAGSYGKRRPRKKLVEVVIPKKTVKTEKPAATGKTTTKAKKKQD